MAKIVPAGLEIWSAKKLESLFKVLETVEKASSAGGEPSRLLKQLDEADKASAKMFVARPKVQDYVDFRQFLHDMRERIEG